MIKVCHFTSAHESNDDRIFLKECQSLSASGYETYIVAKGDSYESEGVKICGVKSKKRGRLYRFLFFSREIYKEACRLNCDIYHFHDPELLPYGLRLKRLGKKVIFDSHEDVPAQIVDKSWIPEILRVAVSNIYRAYESHVVKHLDAVVAATPHIAEQFKTRCKKVEVVNNYPKLDDILFQKTPFSERDPIICYAGGISEVRGEKIMVEAMEKVCGKLILAGDHEKCKLGERVEYVGKISRGEVNELYGASRAGIVVYQPAKNHTESQPIKLFEFMAAGLPVVASDFPLWKEFIEGNDCGICVNPSDFIGVGKACSKLLDNPEEAQRMGLNGYKAVTEKYNWKTEERNLITLYSTL